MINKYLLPLFVVSIAVLFFHLEGINNELYWFYWWYDIPMHILGGVVVALLYAWLSHTFPKIPLLCWKNVLITIISVGFMWEVWELAVGDTSFGDVGYTFDTIKDFVDDTIGACVTYFVIKKTL